MTDENDVFSYHQLLMQLSEMQDQVDAEEVLNLLTKIVDVQLPERKGLVKDDKVATDEVSDSLEDSFLERVISEFPSLCADSLSHDGLAERQLDGSPFSLDRTAEYNFSNLNLELLKVQVQVHFAKKFDWKGSYFLNTLSRGT